MATDTAKPDNAESLAVQNGRGWCYPLAAPNGRIELWNPPRDGERERNRQLGRTNRIAARRSDNVNAALGGGIEIDVWIVLPGLHNQFYAVQGLKQRSIETRAFAVGDEHVEAFEVRDVAEGFSEGRHPNAFAHTSYTGRMLPRLLIVRRGLQPA